jgi:hypothetical protein
MMPYVAVTFVLRESTPILGFGDTSRRAVGVAIADLSSHGLSEALPVRRDERTDRRGRSSGDPFHHR